ncbi:cell wall hydrolase [Paenibacillus sp. FA6]|uniref:cell wall hydrolase n=1 Tax=Paenibacillus sp. FA6 TaxID=3413029 RepID=UPI003F65D21F
MNIIRHNRWIALLIGVILVCFSAISFLLQEEQENNQGRIYKQVTVKETGEYKFKPLLTYSIEHKGTFYTLINKKQQLSIIEQDVVDHSSINNSVNKRDILKNKEMVEQDANVEQLIEVNHQLVPPKVLFFTRTQMLSQKEKEQSTLQYTVTDEELLMLRKIVMAEAEGEPYEGKVAVANVVLNRLRSANFPNTIYKVIYQKYQFSPVANGRFDRVKPSEDTIYAVNEALNGRKEVSDDTYYFLSLKLAEDLTVHHTRTFSATIGNHSFYK